MNDPRLEALLRMRQQATAAEAPSRVAGNILPVGIEAAESGPTEPEMITKMREVYQRYLNEGPKAASGYNIKDIERALQEYDSKPQAAPIARGRMR